MAENNGGRVMLNKQLETYLTRHRITFSTLSPKHPSLVTSNRSAKKLATSLKIREKELAKAVLVKIDDKLALLVEPAIFKTDLELWRVRLKAKRIELANGLEFPPTLADCEKGAIPALGCVYNIDVYLDECLAHERAIVFSTGTRSEFVKMSYKDFAKRAKPKLFHIH